MKYEDIPQYKVRDIKRYFITLTELHGNTVSFEEKIAIIADDEGVSEYLITEAINNHFGEIEIEKDFKVEEYGLVIGRFQPFHFGHQHIINEILLDGKVPIVIIGWDGGKDPIRNPLKPEQVQELIEQVYPGACIFIVIQDKDDWTAWFDSVGHAIVGNSGRHKEQITLYYYNKECDRHKQFECRGKLYHNEFYTEMFKDNGINLKEIEFVERSDIHVDADATNIRDKFEAFKHLMDGRNYWKLKEWGW